MKWFLVILIAGMPNAAFDYYPTKAECELRLAPLIERSPNKFACVYMDENSPDYHSFVNGPSVGC